MARNNGSEVMGQEVFENRPADLYELAIEARANGEAPEQKDICQAEDITWR